MKEKNETLEKVLQYQNEVKTVEETITVLETAITTQQQIIHAANSFTTILPQLLQSRENLLADIAIGKNSKEALDPLDAHIESEQKALDENSANSAKVIPDARATIAGLERNLETTRATLVSLKGRKSDFISAYLKTEAERIGGEYCDAALIVAEKYQALFVLNNLLSNYGNGRGFMSTHCYELALPLFNLDAHTGQDHPTYPGLLKETKLFDVTKTEAVKAEIARIAGLGVEL